MDLAIVGAGAAGSAAAYTLRDDPVDVTVFEKSRGVCGRAATRRKHGCRYDHGANYVKSGSERVTELLTETLPAEGLVEIDEPVWTFDAGGTVVEGDDRDDHKWTYESGITQLAKRLFAETDAEVCSETRVGRLEGDAGEWTVLDTDGGDRGQFDAVLVTPPAPQTAELLADSEADGLSFEPLQQAVEAVPYRTIYTAILHYPFEIDRPWYGLVNTDRDHEVGWLSREELKDGHVPEGESLLVAQMAPEWSRRRDDDPSEAVVADAAELVAELLGDNRLADPDWTDRQRWRYALPDEGIETATARHGEPAGLYVAGDWVAGDGRVHLAVESGLEAGNRIGADAK